MEKLTEVSSLAQAIATIIGLFVVSYVCVFAVRMAIENRMTILDFYGGLLK